MLILSMGRHIPGLLVLVVAISLYWNLAVFSLRLYTEILDTMFISNMCQCTYKPWFVCLQNNYHIKLHNLNLFSWHADTLECCFVSTEGQPQFTTLPYQTIFWGPRERRSSQAPMCYWKVCKNHVLCPPVLQNRYCKIRHVGWRH